jgi:NAD(P)-dependent dehydrogenase (short-subunit alcohol dehydrogenase family)
MNSVVLTSYGDPVSGLLSMKHEMRVMLAQGSGSIVNVSSTYGHTGAAGASIYSASKHAVEGLTKSAALEAASSGVRVNTVAPRSN